VSLCAFLKTSGHFEKLEASGADVVGAQETRREGDDEDRRGPVQTCELRDFCHGRQLHSNITKRGDMPQVALTQRGNDDRSRTRPLFAMPTASSNWEASG
jgi:hypothetical protein